MSLSPSKLQLRQAPRTLSDIQQYGRQAYFDSDPQLRLEHARVLLIVAGGLSSAVALYLGTMGVGTLGIVDEDRVERSNLRRQVLHDEATVGEFKAVSAHKRLAKLNPRVDCLAHVTRFVQYNSLELVQRYDVVVDASDNAATRYLVNAACSLLCKPLVSGSAMGMEGELSVFTNDNSCCYQCLYPQLLAAPMTCAENVLGVLSGSIGYLQATEACKLITLVGAPLVGVQCLYDAYDGQFRRLKIDDRQKSGLSGMRRPSDLDQQSPCSTNDNGQLKAKNRIYIEIHSLRHAIRFPEAVKDPFQKLLKFTDPIRSLEDMCVQQQPAIAGCKRIEEMLSLLICRRGMIPLQLRTFYSTMDCTTCRM